MVVLNGHLELARYLVSRGVPVDSAAKVSDCCSVLHSFSNTLYWNGQYLKSFYRDLSSTNWLIYNFPHYSIMLCSVLFPFMLIYSTLLYSTQFDDIIIMLRCIASGTAPHNCHLPHPPRSNASTTLMFLIIVLLIYINNYYPYFPTFCFG